MMLLRRAITRRNRGQSATGRPRGLSETFYEFVKHWSLQTIPGFWSIRPAIVRAQDVNDPGHFGDRPGGRGDRVRPRRLRTQTDTLP